METKTKLSISLLVIGIILIGGWFILSVQEKPITTNKYQESIYYCEKDDDCTVWWGPDHCGCGNKYYKFPEEPEYARPSLVCEGPLNYTCKCIENKCQ
jgi:hypothetical protein